MTCHRVIMRPGMMIYAEAVSGREIDYDRESWNGRQWEEDERKRIARLEARGRIEWWSNMLCVALASAIVAGGIFVIVYIFFT